MPEGAQVSLRALLASNTGEPFSLWLSLVLPETGKVTARRVISYHDPTSDLNNLATLLYGRVQVFIQVGPTLHVLVQDLIVLQVEHPVLKCTQVGNGLSYSVVPYFYIKRAEELVRIKAGFFINKYAYY